MYPSQVSLVFMITRKLRMVSTFLLERWKRLLSNSRSGIAYETVQSQVLNLCERFTDPLVSMFVGT